jgi:hypothetical protein
MCFDILFVVSGQFGPGNQKRHTGGHKDINGVQSDRSQQGQLTRPQTRGSGEKQLAFLKFLALVPHVLAERLNCHDADMAATLDGVLDPDNAIGTVGQHRPCADPDSAAAPESALKWDAGLAFAYDFK